MARFIIRNYGPSRQIPYKGQSICLSNDQCIETDDAKMAGVLGFTDSIHVTDRGLDAASPAVSDSSGTKKDRKVTVDDAEAVYAENFSDKDVRKPHIQLAEPPIQEEDIDEIGYADMTVRELRALAEDRQIKTSGLRKGELIEALEAYDDAEDLPDDTEE